MLRNFLITLRRFKLASALNIIGLSVAFAAFIVIMMQVVFEQGYGKQDPNYREIFRVESPNLFDKGKWHGQVSGQSIIHLAQNEPRVKEIYYCDPTEELSVSTSENSVNKVITKMYRGYTDPTKLFEFNLIQGTTQGLCEGGDKVIIPRSLASALFLDGNAVGNPLFITGEYYSENPTPTVIGVYEDFPNNATLRNHIFAGPPSRRKDPKTGFLFDASLVFLRTSVADTAQIMDNLMSAKKSGTTSYDFESDRSLRERLTPIGDTYYRDDAMIWFDTQPGNRTTTNMLLGISILIILIAAVNFINFSTALAPVRIKGLNTRLVFGTSRAALRRMLIVEAVGMSVISFCVAMLLAYGFNETPYASLIKTTSLALEDNLDVVIGTGILAVAIGFIAGLYPAFYCTRFKTATVLKGSGMGSQSGKMMRTTLIGFQYVISISLIIGSLFVALQNRYLETFPLGFEKTNTFVVNTREASHNERLLMAAKLQINPQIGEITYSWKTIGTGYGSMSKMNFNGDTVNIGSVLVYHNFLKALGIPIIAGRDFVETDITFNFPDKRGFYYDPNEQQAKIIVNRRAQQMYNIQVDSMYSGRLCIGVCENINARTLYNDYEPICFETSTLLSDMYVKYSGENTQDIYKFIIQSFKESQIPGEFAATLLCETLNQEYIKEHNLSTLINIFSFLAILLSLVGVFGLIVFENQYRRKEIGIRKVYGSSVEQILMMFNMKFIYTVLICFAIAVPITYFAVTKWFGNFAFHMPIHWWVFAAGGAIVLTITMITVTVQSLHSATENPTKSLKSE